MMASFRVNINNLLDTYYVGNLTQTSIWNQLQKHGKVLIRETQYGSDSDVLGTFLLNTDSKKQLKEIMGEGNFPNFFFHMKKITDLITIVIPCYNEELYIYNTLWKISRQNLKGY